MIKYFFPFLILFCNQGKAVSFKDAIEKIKDHEALLQLEGKSEALKEEAALKGSWGDPKFKVSIKNLPSKSFKIDESPMSGIEFGVSQKSFFRRTIFSCSK